MLTFAKTIALGQDISMMKNSTQICHFCAICDKQEPAFIIFEDEYSFAFLDRRPVFLGHCLLAPKKHYQTLLNLPQKLLKPFFHNLQILTETVETGMQAEGSFVAINNHVSQSVPHFHVHIIPRNHGDGLKGFFWPRQKYCDEKQMREIQHLLQKTWKKLT